MSLPDEAVAAAREAVATGQADSVSGYVAEAMSRYSRLDDLALLLADMAAEQGPPTESDRTWARQALGSVAMPSFISDPRDLAALDPALPLMTL
ncbi:MAG: hypothetical protein ACT4OS_02345 [Acidimicrobiales bacterium]